MRLFGRLLYITLWISLPDNRGLPMIHKEERNNRKSTGYPLLLCASAGFIVLACNNEASDNMRPCTPAACEPGALPGLGFQFPIEIGIVPLDPSPEMEASLRWDFGGQEKTVDLIPQPHSCYCELLEVPVEMHLWVSPAPLITGEVHFTGGATDSFIAKGSVELEGNQWWRDHSFYVIRFPDLTRIPGGVSFRAEIAGRFPENKYLAGLAFFYRDQPWTFNNGNYQPWNTNGTTSVLIDR